MARRDDALAGGLVAGFAVGRDYFHLFNRRFYRYKHSRVYHSVSALASCRALPFTTLMRLHHYIRKCAHFTEYFIFSLLILRALRAGRKDARLAWALVAVIIVAGYAALDEFHQSFVPGRTAAVGDVLIDTSGGTAAQIVAGLVLLWGHVRHKRKVASAE